MTTSAADALAHITATRDRMRDLNSRMSQQVADSHRELAALGEQTAAARRAGDHGRAWKILQQRIDVRQTTEHDIYAGIDTTTEAREVRATLKANLTTMRTQVQALRDDDPEIAALTAREEASRTDLDTMLRRTYSAP